MKLGILETGRPPRSLQPQFGDYPAMFRALLGPDAYDYATFQVFDGQLPDRPQACDAYLITGASAGVYDPLPWIAELKAFLVAAKGQAPLVGICFGHQVMAEAFGGRVIKSPNGWGVGLHEYIVSRREPWMDGPDRFRVPASHQDQVVETPPGAQVVAGNAFAPMGMLAYDDQPAISLQLHPEFERDFAEALMEGRRGEIYAPAQVKVAIASFKQPDDRLRIAGWIRRFLAGMPR
jgi:GMP synthase-like glutamine amidotransferase